MDLQLKGYILLILLHRSLSLKVIQIINGVFQQNFQNACLEIGVLEEDKGRNQCLEEGFLIKIRK